ncbi:hypothetical protein [Pedobacter gandavensis]|uniref:Auto-transporter adhesin head GIN domain-containing protein n=1 Tax=Pedobacter gandavensis TaxID=2679963 RepID=A0ABR6EVP7_9SPHI|nr:hypothetical protein [Pedobacter gandavensis]MBB2149287.1 hypothetical protein [Pedobacter gandavensis]
MKTSNMLIIAALIVSLGMVTTYNFSLKAAYEAGDYKNRFKESEFREVKNIETLNITDANLIAIIVEPGKKEGIWIRKRVKEHLMLNQVGNTLTVGLTDEARKTSRLTGYEDIVLVTNGLKKLNTVAYWPKDNKRENVNVYGGEVSLKGIKSTELDIRMASSTSVTMDKMILNTLNVVVGDEKGGAAMHLDPDNQIEFAEFAIPGASKLSLNDPKIVKTRYNLSDKATVTLNGTALQVIKNQ